jgi:hypothetical protein
MLRFTIGLGGSYLREDGYIDYREYSVTYSGFSLASSFDIGGAPVENLVLHARVGVLDLGRPDVSEDNDVLDFSHVPSVNVGLFAAAVTTYFMPANVYITGAVGLSVLTFRYEDSSDSSSTELGVGLNLDVGKEWWVGDQWGLGVAGRVWYSHNAVGDEESEPLSAVDNLVSVSVLFSTTYQ